MSLPIRIKCKGTCGKSFTFKTLQRGNGRCQRCFDTYRDARGGHYPLGKSYTDVLRLYQTHESVASQLEKDKNRTSQRDRIRNLIDQVERDERKIERDEQKDVVDQDIVVENTSGKQHKNDVIDYDDDEDDSDWIDDDDE